LLIKIKFILISGLVQHFIESDTDSNPDEINEEEAIRYSFNNGYSYDEILDALSHHHNHVISLQTLFRRLNSFGLHRTLNQEGIFTQQLFDTAERRINELINGPGSPGGYRTVWHALELEGIYVPRLFVQLYLKEIDPDGCDHRKRHKLKRRVYQNPGPNAAWHIDGYDKIKPWGFPIHGAIDGYSRKVLWLKVTRSNNNPDNIARFYLESVEATQGCPKILVTDLGTENGTAASIQCYFQEDSNAHRYVSSPRNQRIECWWSQFHKVRASWWRLFFSGFGRSKQV